ncbi:MAG: transporter substrate-binding domain-containing protein [Oscillospiraceae bacterium]|nr:transporter substrate-binding domain-containing protein [Oscillospiraceae bacterium]
MKMQNLKKILAVALLCVMFLAILSACGEKETLIIGITDYPPMNYQDDNGKWIGFESEFAEEVGKILGMNVEFQVVTDWGNIVMELNSGNVDLIWNGMTINAERSENMAISTPYMYDAQAIVVRAADKDKYLASADLTGVALVAETGSTLEETIKTIALFNNADYTAVDSQLKGIMEVNAGNADMTVVDMIMAAELINVGGDFSGLVFFDREELPKDAKYGIGVKKDRDDGLLKDLNDAIKKLQDNGKLEEIAKKYGLADWLIK